MWLCIIIQTAIAGLLLFLLFTPHRLVLAKSSKGIISEITKYDNYWVLHVFTLSERDFHIISPSDSDHHVGDGVTVIYNRRMAYLWGERWR